MPEPLVPATATTPSRTPAAPGGAARHRPLDVRAVRLNPAGPLGAMQERNAAATIDHCIASLGPALDYFRRVLGESDAPYPGFVADTDVYKTIEAVAWEIARTGTTSRDAWLDETIGLIARVQEPSGYVVTWVQADPAKERFADLEGAHEMYALGHLIQAAVALDRAAGRDDLLTVARAFADLVDREFGPGGKEGVCGHPEVETALVELYRHTGERRYLDLAARMIDLRGRGLLKAGHLGASYFQDHEPVREARAVAGHAVRQLYLNAGATDVYLETGDRTLLEAMHAQWDSAHRRKMYLTGAFGSRHRDEAFGADYELPSDRAYAETCATIADVHWNWRMLLAGDRSAADYAETIERELHNAVAAAVDAAGTRFFYANPLQLRPDRLSEEQAPRERRPWYWCACCPPNLARLIAQLGAYVATDTGDELALHLHADAEIDVPPHLGGGTLRVATAYPADGEIRLSRNGSGDLPLAVRVPSWSPRVLLDGAEAAPDADGYLRLRLTAESTLAFDLAPRWTRAHHRADALRGCVAIERGPVVYCVEQVDLPGDVPLDDLVVDAGAPIEASGDAGAPRLAVRAAVRPSSSDLYRSPRDGDEPPPSERLTVTAIPFADWGGRGGSAMRVWLPAG
ncbi:glycoside hydrolase family 127 protein [Glycomyces sp. A-F 0318]|uniref:glycoside hydrolase family 127 protein n=1 Tax=Glycomyces amatae TaxID=2881355 RepID=UPI001E46E73E|nr:glycoside hydrolase family 127 protein [Glycomyces amatae]